MKRFLAVLLTIPMTLAVGIGGVAAARPDVSLRYQVSQEAEPGGWFKVTVRAKHAKRPATMNGNAVVHFASGDVVVTLSQKSRAVVATGRVRVPASEAGGVVPVDFTVTYGGATTMASMDGSVDGPAAEPEPEPTDELPVIEY